MLPVWSLRTAASRSGSAAFARAGARTLSRTTPARSELSGTSAQFMDTMYKQWCTDPASCHPSWATYFSQMNGGASPMVRGVAHACPPDKARAGRLHRSPLPLAFAAPEF